MHISHANSPVIVSLLPTVLSMHSAHYYMNVGYLRQ